MKSKVALIRSFGLMACMLVVANLHAQDTLHLTIAKAEEIFLKNNLSLLAAQYNVSASEALIKQAGVWDNPTLATETDAFHKMLPRPKSLPSDQPNGGQVYLNLTQVIRTAGKRGLQVQLAEDGVRTAQAQLADLLRNLRFILLTDLNNLAQLQSAATLLESEITHTQTLAKGMDEMLKVGDVSLKDNVRLKALLYSLQSDYADNLRQQQDVQKELRTLLQIDGNTPLAVKQPIFDLAQVTSITILPVLDSAKALRPDAALASAQTLFQQHNLAYQKALAKPDLTVGVDYDRLSSYRNNYTGVQLSLPLPVFNKNRGNIQAAEWSVKQSQLLEKQTQSVVQAEVLNAYNKLQTLLQVQSSGSGTWAENYEMLMRNMVESYRLRKVNLIDFIDFFSSYRDTKLKQLQQYTNLLNAAAEFNFVTAQNLITLQ
jgi:cobalt-zinc-cadmium efflux system outer membrane protein